MDSIPFVVGQWVRDDRFYGRVHLIDEVLAGQRDWVWLLGQRRVGKTSFLRQLEHLTAAGERGGYFPIYWDFQGAEDQKELQSNLLDALLDTEERLERAGVHLKEVEQGDLFGTLGRLRRAARAAGLKLLLLCDEVEELIHIHKREPSVLRKLRRAMQSPEDMRSVLASTIRLWALADVKEDTSPFLHGFTPPLFINRLTEPEAEALIRQEQLPGERRPSFDAAAVAEIRTRCDCHPYLMQLVCKRFVEQGNLQEAIEQVAIDPMVTHFFSVDFEMLSAAEQDVVRVLSQSTAANSHSIQMRIGIDQEGMSSVLQRLQQLGFIHRNAEQRFELVNYFFRRWLNDQPQRAAARGMQATVPAPSAENTELGMFAERYEVLEQVGEGAFGVVYKARDVLLDEVIALKVLRSIYCSHPEVLARFRQEILLARGLTHPGIVRPYHLGEWKGRQYLTMQWVEGTTLDQLLVKGPLQLGHAARLASRLAAGLEAAHGQKVIHRDIKPQNILLDQDGEPHLTDFGLARLVDAPTVTQAGVFIGTPDYASPEQAQLLPLDERSDIYSLGVVIFVMVTGSKPFHGVTVSGILEQHRSATPPDPRSLRPDLQPAFADAILRCLRKSPAERFPSARDLHQALETIVPAS